MSRILVRRNHTERIKTDSKDRTARWLVWRGGERKLNPRLTVKEKELHQLSSAILLPNPE